MTAWSSRRGYAAGMGKPAVVYRLSNQAESLFPKAYGFVLGQVVRRAARSDGRGAVQGTAGRGRSPCRSGCRTECGPEFAPGSRQRSRSSRSSGGDADIEERADAALVVRGHSCPLASTVSEHPATCGLTESLLSELIGAPVREACERGERPRCAFIVEAV